MKPEFLFLQRCTQIETLLASMHEVDLLDLAARLRQLFVDDYPLVHKVNSNRIKISFFIGRFFPHINSNNRDLAFACLEDGVDPLSSGRVERAIEVKLPDFLESEVLIIRGQSITVREVIKYLSNVAGGVHHGSSKEDYDKALSQVGEFFVIGGLPAGVRVIRAIGRVALRGIEPLIADVKSRLATSAATTTLSLGA